MLTALKRRTIATTAVYVTLLTAISSVALAQGPSMPPRIEDAADTSTFVAAANSSASCRPSKIKFLAAPMDTSQQITGSMTFVKVQSATVRFTQGGTIASCVVVQFSASTLAFDPAVMNVRVLLDGATIAAPGEMPFARDDTGNQVRMANFFFADVAPGSHTIQVELRSIFGQSVVMGRHSTMVQFAP